MACHKAINIILCIPPLSSGQITIEQSRLVAVQHIPCHHSLCEISWYVFVINIFFCRTCSVRSKQKDQQKHISLTELKINPCFISI